MQNCEHNCDKYKEQLFDYVSDILTDEERTAVELHIGSCQNCAKELEDIRAILGAASALAEPEIPEGLRSAVSQRLLNEEKSARLKKKRFIRRVQIAIPLAACAALAIGVYSGGLYDRYMKSDNIISSGENILSTDNIDTEQIYNIPENDAGEVAPKASSNEVSQKETAAAGTEKALPSETAPDIEKSNDTEDLSAETFENFTVAPVEESTQDANIPMVASADSTSAYSVARSIETEESVPETYEKMTDDDSDMASGGSSVSVGASYSAKPDITDTPPAHCTIATGDPDAFASGFGKELTDEAFVLEQEEWKDFVEYVKVSGAQLDADFSEEYTGVTTVIVKN